MRTFQQKQLRTLRIDRRYFGILLRLNQFRVSLASKTISSTILINARACLADLNVLRNNDSIQDRNTSFQIQRRAAQTRSLTRLASSARNVQKDSSSIMIRITTFRFNDRLIRARLINTNDRDNFNDQALNRSNGTSTLTNTIQRSNNTAGSLIKFAQVSTRIRNGIRKLLRLSNKRLNRRLNNLFRTMLLTNGCFLNGHLLTLNRLDRCAPSAFEPVLHTRPTVMHATTSESTTIESTYLILTVSSD